MRVRPFDRSAAAQIGSELRMPRGTGFLVASGVSLLVWMAVGIAVLT